MSLAALVLAISFFAVMAIVILCLAFALYCGSVALQNRRPDVDFGVQNILHQLRQPVRFHNKLTDKGRRYLWMAAWSFGFSLAVPFLWLAIAVFAVWTKAV
jgi:hypothetical protein